MRIIILTLGIFITFFSCNTFTFAKASSQALNSPTNNNRPLAKIADIKIISQNMQRENEGNLSFSTTYLIQNQSNKPIQQIDWYAVYIFNNRIIDTRFIELKFNQFNILQPAQKYYLSTLLPETEMNKLSKKLFTNNASNIKVKLIVKLIQFDDGSIISK
ncbi:hypothetical protein ACFFHK_00210 [Gallibacterium trehalosifermentans]|uniref:DUF4352 domain-containing protein n=1 Tax=Gallibacterium trehalosifermentans TaxID=516935 RepID=A0ABV6GXN2_9PAST